MAVNRLLGNDKQNLIRSPKILKLKSTLKVWRLSSYCKQSNQAMSQNVIFNFVYFVWLNQIEKRIEKKKYKHFNTGLLLFLINSDSSKNIGNPIPMVTPNEVQP